MSDRGKIRIRGRAKQLKDFSGLRFGLITPTDIDGFVDFGNKVFVFIEVKFGDAPISTGQRIAYERLCDACQSAGLETMVLVARHDVADTDLDIDVAPLPVVTWRYKKKWRTPSEKLTVRSAIEKFMEWCA